MPRVHPARAMLVLTVLLCCVSALYLPRPAAGQSSGCAVGSADLTVDGEEQAALDAMNALRSESRLPPLLPAPSLAQAAAWKSANMAATGVFGHDDAGRGWWQRIVECGYQSPATENLAVGVETGRAVAAMWRDSAVHRANMLDPSARVAGVARARAASGVWYWTAVFGMAVESQVADRPATRPAPARVPVDTMTAPAPGGAATDVRAGAGATVNAGRGDCLNVRAEPAMTARVIACLADGTAVTITAGPREAGSVTWWQIDGGGWASGEFLAAAVVSMPTPSR
jgi:uncharacterized protein YkwD